MLTGRLNENLAELCRSTLTAIAASAFWSKGLPVEDLTELPTERLRREWFVQERDPRIEDAVVDDGLVRVPGHVDDLERRPSLDQPLGQLRSAAARHHDIGQEHVDGRVLVEQPSASSAFAATSTV